jgi:DNA polymerase III alpha subunit (gram-positive type)
VNKHMSKDVVFIDVEATGTDVYNDQVIEIGATRCNSAGDILSNYQTKVRFEHLCSQEAASINGYNSRDWSDAILFKDAISELYTSMIAKYPASCHIVSYFTFDQAILKNQCRYHHVSFPFETIPWTNFADMVYPLVLTGRVDSRKLGDIAEYLGITEWQAHRALSDAQALSQCYFKFLEQFDHLFLTGALTTKAYQGIASLFGRKG